MKIYVFIKSYFERCKIPNLNEIRGYYPLYLKSHLNPINKLLHLVGNIFTHLYWISILFFSIIFSPLFLLLLIFTPFIVYPFAWGGHLFAEKNKPATFKQNPLLTKACDQIMMKDLLLRNIPLDGRKERIESRK